MAIRVRRGAKDDFDPTKMLPGEWAISTDSNTLNQIVWMCFAPGVTKRMGTYEDFKQQILEATEGIKEEYINEFQEILDEIESLSKTCNENTQEMILIKNDIVNTYFPQIQKYSTEAKSSAQSSVQSEVNAKQSATNAKNYADQAKKSAEQAMSTTPEGYNALVEQVDLIDIQRSNDYVYPNSKAGGLKLLELSGNSKQKTYSGKNELNYGTPIEREDNGITYTPVFNEDGTLAYVNVNGKATRESLYGFGDGYTTLSAGIHLLSGVPDGTDTKNILLDLGKVNDDGFLEWEAYDYSTTITYPRKYTFEKETDVTVAIFITTGTVVNNLKIYPMISVEGGEYEPYVDTPAPNPNLPQEIESLGCKNLIPYPYYDKTKTLNDIVFTDNGDFTVTVNGTASETTSFIFNHRIDKSLVLGAGEYKVSGCPVGGSNTTYRVIVARSSSSGTFEAIAIDTGSGATFTITEETDIYVGIEIKRGAIVNNITFKPMLRKADILDDTYAPPGTIGIKVRGKNHIPYPYKEIAPQQTITHRGIAFTDNGDGSITGIGTPDNGNPSTANLINFHRLPAGTYILSDSTKKGLMGASAFIYSLVDGKYVNYTGEYDGFLVNSAGNVFIFTTQNGSNPSQNNLYGYSKTFTIKEDAYVNFQARSMTISYTSKVDDICYPMLRKCDENGIPIGDDVFEVYREHIEYIKLETLRKIGNFTDRIIKKNSVWCGNRNIARAILNRDNLKSVSLNNQYGNFAAFTLPLPSLDSDDEILVSSNMFVGVACNNRAKNLNSYRAWCDNGGVCIRDTSANLLFTSEDAIKNFLDENEVYIDYVLAEPTFTPLDEESQKALNRLVTFDGATYLDIVSTIEPSGIEVEYATSRVGVLTLENERLRERLESDVKSAFMSETIIRSLSIGNYSTLDIDTLSVPSGYSIFGMFVQVSNDNISYSFTTDEKIRLKNNSSKSEVVTVVATIQYIRNGFAIGQ